MVHYVKGNLLEADVDYICHQVNCQGKMNSGIAKSIREKWPTVYESYREWCFKNKVWIDPGVYDYSGILGEIQVVSIPQQEKFVINMAGQRYYGTDQKYTSYDAFWNCLTMIKANVSCGSRIGFPDHISCCRGGANWEVIRTMIEQVLGKDYDVYIYRLE